MRAPRRRWRRALLTLLGVLVLLQMSALVLPRELSPPAPLSWLLRMVLYGADVAGRSWETLAATWDIYLNTAQTAATARQLAAENAALRFALAEAEAQLKRDAALVAMLGWTLRPWDGVVAHVAYHDVTDRGRAFWLRGPAGADLTGHAVAVPEGVLGRVVRSNGRYGQVLLVNDAESAIDAISQSGVRVIVRGSGTRRGKLAYVPHYEPLGVGDRLQTTGKDGVFPPGLPVGVVVRIDRNPENLFLEGDVAFYADPATVTWVRTFPPTVIPDRAPWR